MKYLALTGYIPLKSCELIGAKITIQRLVRRMKAEGYAIAYASPERYIMLSAAGKQKLKQIDEKQYEHLQSVLSAAPIGPAGENNVEKTRKIRRNLQQSKILILLDSLGIKCWNYEKPTLSLISPAVIPENRSLYYTSIEIKAMDNYEHKNKISHTRAYGLLLSPGGNFCIYHVGNGKMEWNQYGETKIVVHCETVISKNSGVKGKANLRQAIVYTNSYNSFAKVLEASEKNTFKQKYEFFSFNNVFDNMYYVPIGIEGKAVTSLLIQKNHHKRIIDYLYDKSYVRPKMISVDCDVTRDGDYYLSFLECDICRLKRFKQAMDFNDKRKFHITCFEWQYDALREYLPEECEIETVRTTDVLRAIREDE